MFRWNFRGAGAIVTAVIVTSLASLAFGAAVARASEPSPSSSAASSNVVLRIGWPREPDNLNPFIGWENSSYEVWALNYDFLFGFGKDEQPTLDLAAEFPTKENGGISPDGKTWTIKIRQGVKWQDGQPLTAEDVAFTFNYSIENELYAFGIMTIGIDHVEVVDPYTVKFVCTRPKADLERMWVPILPQHIWSKVKPGLAETSHANKPPIVGSGPFQVVEFKKGRYTRMVRNPYYWGKKPTVDEIVFLTYQNVDTMTQDLKLGTIDAAWGLPQAQYKQLSSTPGLTALSYNYRNWDYLDINCYDQPASLGNPVLRDEAFRNALNYAIDRDRLVSIVWNGNAQPATTILPPDTWFDPDYHWQPATDQLYTFDVAKAKQLLADAGYKDTNGNGILNDPRNGDKDITLRLYALAGDIHGQGEGKLITGWLNELGLKIQFEVIDEGALEDRLWNYKGDTYAPDFDLYLWDWDGYDDPGQTLATLTTAQIESWNEPCWSNGEYDKLAVEQAAELDSQKRKDLIWQMQQIMYEQTPWVVLTYPDHLEAYNTDKWTGWTRVMNGNGPAFYTAGNIDTYLNLKPQEAAASSSGSSSLTTVLVVAGVVLVVVVVLLVVWVRRRPHAVEE